MRHYHEHYYKYCIKQFFPEFCQSIDSWSWSVSHTVGNAYKSYVYYENFSAKRAKVLGADTVWSLSDIGDNFWGLDVALINGFNRIKMHNLARLNASYFIFYILLHKRWRKLFLWASQLRDGSWEATTYYYLCGNTFISKLYTHGLNYRTKLTWTWTCKHGSAYQTHPHARLIFLGC